MKINRGAGVLTISDKASQGQREDLSGLSVSKMLDKEGFKVLKKKIVPDDLDQIVNTLLEWADSNRMSLIVTSGGTGLSPKDLTPQAMKRVIDYEVPGMAEAMRAASLKKTPHAMISRAIVGVRGSSLIINLPGSPKGAEENISVLFPALVHALEKLQGDPSECAT